MRIVTRPDFDGIVCAVLLLEAEAPDLDIYWAEPNQIQAGIADIQPGDIIANLPPHPDAGLWFDHHVSNTPEKPLPGAFHIAPSAAGVIYEYYKSKGKLDNRYDELILNTDMIDSADLNRDQVKRPEDYPYILLSMTIKNKDFEDIAYWNRLVEMLRRYRIEKVMADPEVAERAEAVIRENQAFGQYLLDHTTVKQRISITDFRSLDKVPSGNRFLTYSLFPDTMASVKIRYASKEKKQVLISVGHSIFTPDCKVNVGRMLAKYGGGGHRGAGGCTLDAEGAQEKIDEILQTLMDNSA
ncbi:MAG TPA: exopolyphosphatase [Desulfobacteraceae bacterium]|nr:exopolyphosphatase [Desulfobacteraceae bacterium]